MPLAKNIKMTQCGDLALGEGNFSANENQAKHHDRSASKMKIYAWFSLLSYYRGFFILFVSSPISYLWQKLSETACNRLVKKSFFQSSGYFLDVMSSIIVVKFPRLKQPKPQKLRKKYGGRRGIALPTFLNCLAINELMTFWTFLAKSCYWNSFLLSFQDYLLLFTFFNHYINMGVFIPLIWVITACVQWTKGEGGKKSNPLLTEMNSQSERLRFPSILLRIPISIR